LHQKWLGSTGGTVECFATEIARADAQLDLLYKKRMTALKPSAQTRLSSAQQFWLGDRYDGCEADYAEEDGGTLRSIVRKECMLTEISRRTQWVKRFK
jgi:uncharacterized protein YecT (DUF1311 family)